MELEAQIREAVALQGGFEPDFPAEADFYADLGMASVKAMQLLVELEDQFGVRIPDEEFVQATSLEALTALIAGLKDSAGA